VAFVLNYVPGKKTKGDEASKLPLIVGTLVVLLTLAGMAALISSAASRRVEYTMGSPDDLVKAAVTMIRNGEAEKLSTLFYAETPEMGSIFRRLGELLGSMQDLGSAVAKRFPDDIAKLRDEATKKAVESNPAATIATALAGNQQQRRRGPPGEGDQRMIEDAAKALFADPFGWLDRNAARLSTTMVSDDQAAVLFDGKPMPPFGLSLRQSGGRWYIELPLNMPGVSQFLPQTRHEYSIFGSLIKVLDNTIRELTDDVRSGQVRKIEKLAERAGEKALGPALMVFIVYGKEMDVRQRREKAMGAFRKKLTAWTQEREATLAGLGDDAVRKLKQTLEKLAVEELDQLVRIDTTRPNREAPRAVPAFADQSIQEFEATLEGWLLSRGVRQRLAEPPGAGELEAAMAAATQPSKAKPTRRGG
jgi:hypothetical protein